VPFSRRRGRAPRLLSASFAVPAIPLALLLHPLHHLVDLALSLVLSALARGRLLPLLPEFTSRFGALVNVAFLAMKLRRRPSVVHAPHLPGEHGTLTGRDVRNIVVGGVTMGLADEMGARAVAPQRRARSSEGQDRRLKQTRSPNHRYQGARASEPNGPNDFVPLSKVQGAFPWHPEKTTLQHMERGGLAPLRLEMRIQTTNTISLAEGTPYKRPEGNGLLIARDGNQRGRTSAWDTRREIVAG
jgi:hypothetical protein